MLCLQPDKRGSMNISQELNEIGALLGGLDPKCVIARIQKEGVESEYSPSLVLQAIRAGGVDLALKAIRLVCEELNAQEPSSVVVLPEEEIHYNLLAIEVAEKESAK